MLKLFASRVQDVQDTEAIVIRYRYGIDSDYVQRHLAPLIDAKGDPPRWKTPICLRAS